MHMPGLHGAFEQREAGQQALCVLAYLRKGETYTDLAVGFGIGTSTVFRYVRDALDVLAARASGLSEAITVAASKALVIIDGTLLRIDRVGMVSGRDRPFYSGKHQRHGVNVQVGGRSGRPVDLGLTRAAEARHNMGAAREHGLIEALAAAGIRVLADSAYRGAGVNVEIPQRRRRKDPETGQRQRLSANQKAVNSAHAQLRGPGERANALLKNWKILRRIRACWSTVCKPSSTPANPKWETLSDALTSPDLMGKVSRCMGTRRRGYSHQWRRSTCLDVLDPLEEV